MFWLEVCIVTYVYNCITYAAIYVTSIMWYQMYLDTCQKSSHFMVTLSHKMLAVSSPLIKKSFDSRFTNKLWIEFSGFYFFSVFHLTLFVY